MQRSYERNLLDADALAMIEGVMQVSEMQARDIMIPRAQMDVIDIGDAPEKFIPWVIETGHSRFPVVGENKDDVIGILLQVGFTLARCVPHLVPSVWPIVVVAW